MKRRQPIRVRGRSRFPKRRNLEYVRWIRKLACLLEHTDECSGRTEAAHVKGRAAGGNDVGNTVPLCFRHHFEQHAIGLKTFEGRYGIDLAREAQRYAKEYEEYEAAA